MQVRLVVEANNASYTAFAAEFKAMVAALCDRYGLAARIHTRGSTWHANCVPKGTHEH